jgi:hypothetical protein
MDLGEYKKTLFNAYHVNGYVVLKGMLSGGMALHLRTYIAAQFLEGAENKPYDTVNDANIGSIKLDVFNRFPEAYRQIFFNSPFIFHMKLLLGDDFVLIPETGIHKNSFGGWHKDVGMQQRAGLTFHWEEDFHVVTVAFYFQANTLEYGGGLEVIPRSHTIRFPEYPADARGERVANESGDVAVFNHNLDHKASWPANDITGEHTKYALFMCASKNNSHAAKYLSYLKTRPVYSWMQHYSYPEDLVRHSVNEGYVLAC